MPTEVMFIDSHVHLDSPDFASDLHQVLARAREAAVTRVLTVGTVTEDISTVSPTLALVHQWEEIVAAVGVHPHDARFFTDELGSRILDLMTHPKVVAWGEIGLDFYYDHSPRDQQEWAFRQQIRSARLAGKPIIVHSRNAEEETCRILEEEYMDSPNRGGVLHCFTASGAMALRCLELGFYVSFGGIVSFRKASALRGIAKRVPKERLLIETDCPYLAPAPYRGKRNEPAYVTRVAEVLAEVRGVSKEEIGTQTAANFERLFGVFAKGGG